MYTDVFTHFFIFLSNQNSGKNYCVSVLEKIKFKEEGVLIE